MARKFDHRSKPAPRTSPAINGRRVIVPHDGNASVGHNLYSQRRGRRPKCIIAGGARAPGSKGPPLAPGIGPGGYRGMS
jgi:hypothetical protein